MNGRRHREREAEEAGRRCERARPWADERRGWCWSLAMARRPLQTEDRMQARREGDYCRTVVRAMRARRRRSKHAVPGSRRGLRHHRDSVEEVDAAYLFARCCQPSHRLVYLGHTPSCYRLSIWILRAVSETPMIIHSSSGTDCMYSFADESKQPERTGGRVGAKLGPFPPTPIKIPGKRIRTAGSRQ